MWTASLDSTMITKLLWSKSGKSPASVHIPIYPQSHLGQQLSVGDDRGRVSVYSTTDRGLYMPEEEEWEKLERAVGEMRDGDELIRMLLSAEPGMME